MLRKLTLLGDIPRKQEWQL